jgi:glycosidase
MTNVAFPSIDDYRDIETLNMYREAMASGGIDPDRVMAMIHKKSRDNARTPMQWTAGPQCRFHHRHTLDRGQPEPRPRSTSRRRSPIPIRSSTTTGG